MKSLVFYCLLVISLNLSCKDSVSTETEKDANSTDKSISKSEGEKTIIFFGNSLTAGYGLEESEAFPAIIDRKLDSMGLNYNVVNAGNSGETTSGGLNRVDWILKQDVDIFVLELGANDGLRGIPISETKQNLESIIEIVRKNNSDTEILLAGMQLPPNMGRDYTEKFRKMFPELAEEKNVKLIPFLLEGVGGVPSLNLTDGIHPTAAGHKILAENVWNILEGMILNTQPSS